LEKFFSDKISDFAPILAVCRARTITIPTIHSASYESHEAEWMVGLVIARARHTAKIGAKKGCFTAYLALKGCVKAKTVCLQTERLSVPVIYFHITTWFEPEPAEYAPTFI
jgi:hypothetical protein